LRGKTANETVSDTPANSATHPGINVAKNSRTFERDCP